MSKKPLQSFTATVTESAANTYTTKEVDIPTNVYDVAYRLIEIVQIDWEVIDFDIAPAAGDNIEIELTYIQFSAMQGTDSPFMIKRKVISCIFVASGALLLIQPLTDFLIDTAGHGKDVARESIWIAVDSTNQTNPIEVKATIHYRRIRSTTDRYIALFQSQSN